MSTPELPKPFVPDALVVAQLTGELRSTQRHWERANRDVYTADRALSEALTPFRIGDFVEYVGPMIQHRGRYVVTNLSSPTSTRGLVSAAPITKAGHPHPNRRTRFEHGRSAQYPVDMDHIPDADHLVKAEAKQP